MNATIALFTIARPTFDVPLAQSVATAAKALLEGAGHMVAGPGDALLMDGSAAQEAANALLRRGGGSSRIDLIVILQASFADSGMAVEITETLHALGVPLLLWALPEARSGGRLRLNSFCGINLAGHALSRRGLAYEYLLQPADAPEALHKLEQAARVGRSLHLLRRTRIGLVGDHPPGFDTCDYDVGHLQALFGADVAHIPLENVLRAAAATSPAERRVFLEQAARLVDNLGELDADATAGTAGVYSVLRRVAEEENLAGLAVRCWPEFFTELGCAACGAMSMLTEEGRPAACEADVNGALMSVLLQTLSESAAFLADLVSMDAESDSGVFWHCGLAPVSMADPDAPISGTVHSNRKLPFLFEFPLKPGRITIARLHRRGQEAGPGDYQLVIGGGEMVRAPKSFGGTSGVVRFDRPVPQVLDTIMDHGLEHHFNITYGDVQDELRMFARWAGLPVLELT